MARKPTPEERIFAAGLATGARRGAENERQDTIRVVAASLLADDVSDAVRLVEGNGEGALPLLAVAAREAWPKRWRERLGPVILRVMQTAEIVTDRGTVALGFDVRNPENGAFFKDYMLRLSTSVTDTTRERLESVIRGAIDEGLGVPETARRISEVGEDFQGYRSVLIARTELLNASRGAAQIAAKNSSVVSGKKWHGALDSRERPEHLALEGVTVGIDEDFPNGEGQYPTKPMCRCTLLYLISPELLRDKSA